MYDELYLTSFFMDESEQVCGNCAHWDTRHMIAVTVSDAGPFGQVSHHMAPCRDNAVEMDAGEGGIPMLAGTSHCLCHRAAFSPSPDFLEELADRAARYDQDAYNGVRPGIDCSATLRSVA